MQDPWRMTVLDCSILEEHRGVAFPHYWFYKLEFILWYMKRTEMNDPRWEAFRITAKNSVEHISPQTPQTTDQNRVSDHWLDSFGNLALVSRSINSEYGNLPFNEKRQRFINRNVTRLDSLKMALIYNEHARWNDSFAAQHQRDIIQLVKAYFSADSNDGTAQTPDVVAILDAVTVPSKSESVLSRVPADTDKRQGAAESHRFQYEYWDAYRAFLASIGEERKPSRSRFYWQTYSLRIPRFSLAAIYALPNMPGHIAFAYSFYNDPSDRIRELVIRYQHDIEKVLGYQLFQSEVTVDEHRWLYTALESDAWDREDWPNQFAWYRMKHAEFSRAIMPYLELIRAQ